MKPCFFLLRCRCKERRLFNEIHFKNKTELNAKKKKTRPPRPVYFSIKPYYSIKFEISYPNFLTPETKILLMSFKNKYIYYAIDDLLYLIYLKKSEKVIILNMFYSTMLFLYYNANTIFFDIWIDNISLIEIENNSNLLKSKKITSLTFNLLYQVRGVPRKKQEQLW